MIKIVCDKCGLLLKEVENIKGKHYEKMLNRHFIVSIMEDPGPGSIGPKAVMTSVIYHLCKEHCDELLNSFEEK